MPAKHRFLRTGRYGPSWQVAETLNPKVEGRQSPSRPIGGRAMAEENIEFAQRAVEAFNRGDGEAVLTMLSPEVESSAAEPRQRGRLSRP